MLNYPFDGPSVVAVGRRRRPLGRPVGRSVVVFVGRFFGGRPAGRSVGRSVVVVGRSVVIVGPSVGRSGSLICQRVSQAGFFFIALIL